MRKWEEERCRRERWKWTDRCSTNIWRCGAVFIADIKHKFVQQGQDAQQVSLSVKGSRKRSRGGKVWGWRKWNERGGDNDLCPSKLCFLSLREVGHQRSTLGLYHLTPQCFPSVAISSAKPRSSTQSTVLTTTHTQTGRKKRKTHTQTPQEAVVLFLRGSSNTFKSPKKKKT